MFENTKELIGEGEAFQIEPLHEELEVVRRPPIRLEQPCFEKGHPLLRNHEGNVAVEGLQLPFVIAVPTGFLAHFRRRLLAGNPRSRRQGLVEGPLKFGPDERIQILFDGGCRLLGRHRRKRSHNRQVV